MGKKENLLYVIASIFFFVSGTAFAKNENINLSVGLSQDVPIPEAPGDFGKAGTFRKCVALQYNDQTRILRIEPKKEGFCTLEIKHPTTEKVIYSFTLDVKKTDLNKVAREMKALLNEIEGIQIKIANNKVIVDGQVLLPRDVGRIHSVVKQYGELATTLVVLSPAAEVKIASFIERAIGNPEIHVRAVNGKFMLEGVAETKDEKDKAEIIAKTYVPDIVVDEPEADKKIGKRVVDIVINLITIKEAAAPEPSKIIQIVVHYVELQKDYSKGFRFQWTPDIGDGSSVNFSSGGRGPSGLTSTITGTISNLLPKLNWAKEHGHARVLQSASIIVEDNKAGTLNSIQRIPYQTVSAEGLPSTNFEEAGIRTEITPKVQGARSDSVHLNMKFSVKSLLGINAQGPLTSSREIATQLVVKSSQSAAIGGLITNDTSTGYNKLPANTSTNPIFSLYTSKDFRRNQSQFVVFVTPIIKASASAGTEQIKKRFRLRD
jgi:pilus assembly protein CpaC